jgi:hypothetical protein
MEKFEKPFVRTINAFEKYRTTVEEKAPAIRPEETPDQPAHAEKKEPVVEKEMMVEFVPNPEIDAGDKKWPVKRDDVIKVITSIIPAKHMKPGMMIYLGGEIAGEIQRNAVTDWDKRDTILARMRNIIRVVLRKRGCPPEFRDQIADGVIKLVETAAEPASDENSE